MNYYCRQQLQLHYGQLALKPEQYNAKIIQQYNKKCIQNLKTNEPNFMHNMNHTHEYNENFSQIWWVSCLWPSKISFLYC